MTTKPENDILASNLLFVTIVLSVLGELGQLAFRVQEAHQAHLPLGIQYGKLLALLGLSVGIRAGLFYGVRRGLLAAKLLVAVGFIVFVCYKTDLAAGRIAEVDFPHLWGYPLLVLVRNLLTVAALGLMFTKPRVAPSHVSHV